MAEASVSTSKSPKSNEELLKELANDYTKYVEVDFQKEKQGLEENIEEMLLRLDEFVGLVDVIRSDNTQCLNHSIPDIYAKTQALEVVYSKIDRLESFMTTVRQNVETLEEKVSEAERDLQPENSLSKVFRPLFKKKDPSGAAKNLPVYHPPEIFRTSEYFPNQPDDEFVNVSTDGTSSKET